MVKVNGEGEETAALTIWFKFCCDCGPAEPAAGGGTAFCCGGMLLCGGRPALGGPLPTLMARETPGPCGGPDMLEVVLLFHYAAPDRIQLELGSVVQDMDRVSERVNTATVQAGLDPDGWARW